MVVSVQTDYYSYKFVLRKLEARVCGRQRYEYFTEQLWPVAVNMTGQRFVCSSVQHHKSFYI